MGWFGKREKPPTPEPPAAAEPEDEDDGDGEALYCVACGAELGLDPEDAPNAEGPGRHLCGACYRAREFDSELEMRWFRGDV